MEEKPLLVREIRSFNRFYTHLLGLLNNYLLNSEFSLVEARILYEIHNLQPVSATQIMAGIEIDKGYLSKVIKQFEKINLIEKAASDTDARISLLSLTKKGESVFEQLNSAADDQIAKLINHLSVKELNNLITHMKAIKGMIEPSLS